MKVVVTVRRTLDAYSVKVVGDEPKIILDRDPSTKQPSRRLLLRASEDTLLTATIVQIATTARDEGAMIGAEQLMHLAIIAQRIEP